MSIAPHRALKALTGLLCAVLLLAGCTMTVQGKGEYAEGGVKKNAPPSELNIQNSDGSETDQQVANALDDAFTFWKKQMPKVFGKEFQEPAGGIYSYTPEQSEPIPCFEGDNSSAAQNAFYCSAEDIIAFDRNFMAELSDTYGPFLVALVMSHEVGHLVQSQTSGLDDKAIALETQADCYAGAFSQSAQKGTKYYDLTSEDLDAVLGGYLLFRDQPGESADDPSSHGSGFDRVAAFQEGFYEGAGYCKDAFGPDREYTEFAYNENEQKTGGNLSYEEIVGYADTEMNAFGDAVASDEGKSWEEVPAEPADGAVTCDGKKQDDQVYYCKAESTVLYDDSGAPATASEKYGDFAVMELFALAYSDAILNVTGSKTKGADRLTAQLCLSGVYAGDAFEKTVEGTPTAGGLKISPGDLDEAIALLIGIGEDDQVINTYKVDAFDRINAFREGFNSGREDGLTASAC
ncbi:hypothetical protein EK0264_16645 [Epidermidibacterium keratini]|uniref:Metalloprotease n=1 Tax=Epidermidibacterium keratini TaxID=1891644 RepID=A0A7L4YRS2_9ACTN|nr:neutral zinc metallopeptidase [Epidermidibacterium keratini]QHC01748.1 hypothetical protein EK0264_16645 [Epidermidibacterium keratini]